MGNYAGVVIAGAAGVGKTRLARELLAQAAAAGTRTNWIVGTASARPIPLGAFSVALGDAAVESAPSVRRVINALVAQQRQGRVLIGVDDAHLLDGSTPSTGSPRTYCTNWRRPGRRAWW